jgi:hypothetical protein
MQEEQARKAICIGTSAEPKPWRSPKRIRKQPKKNKESKKTRKNESKVSPQYRKNICGNITKKTRQEFIGTIYQ